MQWKYKPDFDLANKQEQSSPVFEAGGVSWWVARAKFCAACSRLCCSLAFHPLAHLHRRLCRRLCAYPNGDKNPEDVSLYLEPVPTRDLKQDTFRVVHCTFLVHSTAGPAYKKVVSMQPDH